jgi:DnaJ-class molecular chaperone
MMKKGGATFYDVLGLSPQATDADVRGAYRMLALRWHPDRNPQNRSAAHTYCALLNRAYAHLRTAPQRRAYDRYLAGLAQARRRPALHSRPQKQTQKNEPRREGFLSILKEIFWPLAPYQQEVRTGG